MRIPWFSTYLLLAATAIVGIFVLLMSEKKSSKIYNSKHQDTNILVHPEKYYYYDARESSKLELNGKAAFIDLFDAWTEFIPGLYIHSAFADAKNESSDPTVIRILGVGKKVNIDKNRIKCLMRKNNTMWEESLIDLLINYQQSFIYFMVICISKHNIIPQSITLNYTSIPNKNNLLEVHYESKEKLVKNKITVCVLPISQKFDDTQLLAEFLSYYDTVGVSSFVLYDYNMTGNIKKFIDTVSRSGVNIKIVPWTIKADTVFSMQKVLQLASIQHCIFQNRGIAKYVLPINFDEFLVPRQHFSLHELMDELSTVSKRNIGSYVFRQSYFCKQNVTSERKEDIQLVSTSNIFREDQIWSSKKTSKYMVHPDSVVEGGLYHILKHVKGWISANVPWQMALIHHYVSCPQQKNIAKLIEDRTAESFRYEILLSKPMKAYKEFKDLTT